MFLILIDQLMFKELCKQHFPITLRILTTYFHVKDLETRGNL